MRTSVTGTAQTPILTVSLRNSVGSTWTIVLGDDQAGVGPVAWISSGVPIEDHPPTDIADSLEQHGYRFLPAQLRGAGCRRIGFAWRAGTADASETCRRLDSGGREDDGPDGVASSLRVTGPTGPTRSPSGRGTG